ncbi:MAG: hypothetical protein NC918_07065, partial [Candidatus Omnitrophica bacterium]|nr:hypothetical protein [Candidatus Omnitrophota bacterium]
MLVIKLSNNLNLVISLLLGEDKCISSIPYFSNKLSKIDETSKEIFSLINTSFKVDESFIVSLSSIF